EQGGEIAFRPVQAAQSVQLLAQFQVSGSEMDDVVGRIAQLRIGQGPERPVGARMSFAQAYSEQFRNQSGIADLFGQADQGSRDLGIEDRCRQFPPQVEEDFQILSPGMKYLGDGGIKQQIRYRLQGFEGE